MYKFIVCNPPQFLTILVPFCFIITSLMFFYISKLLFSGFHRFEGNFVHSPKMIWYFVQNFFKILSGLCRFSRLQMHKLLVLQHASFSHFGRISSTPFSLFCDRSFFVPLKTFHDLPKYITRFPRLSSLEKYQNKIVLTCIATIQLQSHGNMSSPADWSDTDRRRSYGGLEVMADNWVSVAVGTECLQIYKGIQVVI